MTLWLSPADQQGSDSSPRGESAAVLQAVVAWAPSPCTPATTTDEQDTDWKSMRQPQAANGLGRQVVESLLCLAIAVLLFRCYALEGYIISTGSMAPNLLGYHKRVECPDCGYRFPYGVAFDREVTTSSLVRCPNCMQPAIDVSDVPRNDGDQLLVFKQAYDFRDPRRWEVVVFLNPANPLQAYVKRVVGLPGESIQVRDGDVYINGRIERKTLEKQRAMRIPVFDQNFKALAEDWLPRWIPDSGWAQTDRSFVRSLDELDQPAWVQFRPWPRQLAFGSAGRSLAPLPILDGYGYNRIYGMDEDHPVHDFALVAKVDCPSKGQLISVLQARSQWAACVLDASQSQVRLYLLNDDAQLHQVANGRAKPVAQVTLAADQLGQGVDFEFSNFDQTLQVGLQGQLVLKHNIEPVAVTTSPAIPSVRPIGSKPLVQRVRPPEAEQPAQGFGMPPGGTPAHAEITIAGYDSVAPDAPNADEIPVPSSDQIAHEIPAATRSQVRFGALGGAFRVREIQIFRDVHYLSGRGQHACDGPCRLGSDEFFFLGDNSPVSLDSRGWKYPAVPRRLLVGRPICVHMPSRPVQFRFGSRETLLRVPDLDNMRLIR